MKVVNGTLTRHQLHELSNGNDYHYTHVHNILQLQFTIALMCHIISSVRKNYFRTRSKQTSAK